MSPPTQKDYDNLCNGYDTVMLSLQDAEAALAVLRSACQQLAKHMKDVVNEDWAVGWMHGEIEHWAEQLEAVARVAPGAEAP